MDQLRTDVASSSFGEHAIEVIDKLCDMVRGFRKNTDIALDALVCESKLLRHQQAGQEEIKSNMAASTRSSGLVKKLPSLK